MSSKVLAIVVTYHPQTEVLGNLRALRSQVDGLVVVDNGSSEEALQMLRSESVAQQFDLIENAGNLGIATALNLGVARALVRSEKWVMLFDQDSCATPGMVQAMLQSFAQHESNRPLGLLVPAYRDMRTGIPIAPEKSADGSLEVAITSGSLFRVETLRKAGPFADELFIDAVDLEYSLRLRSLGYVLCECREAVLLHSPGEPMPQRNLGMQYSTTNYSPVRRYYQARNRIWMLRRYGFKYPRYLLKLLYATGADFAKILLKEEGKTSKSLAMLRGVVDGVRNKMGSAPSLRT